MATLEARLTAVVQRIRDQFNAIMPRLVKAGGATGQMLAKASATNYDTVWVDPPSGGGGGSSDPLTLSDRAVAPSAPTTGIKVYGLNKAGRRRPGWVGPSGIDTAFQEFIGGNKIGLWSAGGNSTTAFNNANPGLMLWNFGHSTQGTVTARNVAITNLFTSTRRLGFRTGTTATTTAGTRHGFAQFSRKFGFEYVARFGISEFTTDNYALFVGMTATPNALGIGGPLDPAVPESFYFGKRHASRNLEMVFQPSGSGATQVFALDTTLFPWNTANTNLYEVRFFVEPTGSSNELKWRVENLSTGDYVEGSFDITATLSLQQNTLLSPQIAMGNDASTNMAVDVVSQYIVTDF